MAGQEKAELVMAAKHRPMRLLALPTRARLAPDLLTSKVSIVPVLSLAIPSAVFLSPAPLVRGPRERPTARHHGAGIDAPVNITLKAQLEALERHLARVEIKRKRVARGI